MEAQLSPMPLCPHPCAARHGPPCWRASTSITTTPTPTMRTAPPLPGKLSTSHAHSPSISTTPATGQVGEQRLSYIATFLYTTISLKGLMYVHQRPVNAVLVMFSHYFLCESGIVLRLWLGTISLFAKILSIPTSLNVLLALLYSLNANFLH